MICLVVLGIVLLILFLLAVSPVGVDGRYQEGKASVFLKFGPIRFQLFPWKRKQKKTKNKAEKQKKRKTKKDSEQQPETAGGKKDYWSLIKILFRALRRFQHKLSIDLLMLHYTAASDDPYDTVMQYGRLSAVIGSFSPLAKQMFHVKKQDIVLDLTFETEKPIITARLVATLRIWEIFSLTVCTLFELLK